MSLSEADTRTKLIDPAIHKCGWTEDLIRREETAGAVEIVGGKARRRSRGKADYVLRVKINPETQPVTVALIEAKKDTLPPGHGLDQAKGYAALQAAGTPAGMLHETKERMFAAGRISHGSASATHWRSQSVTSTKEIYEERQPPTGFVGRNRAANPPDSRAQGHAGP